MSGLSKMIADFFVRENVIEHEEYEIYKYGAYCEAKRPDLRSETVAFRF